MRISSMILWKNMTSRDTNDVKPGKIVISCKIRRKYYWIFIKISEYLYFSTSRCSIVFFKENRNLLSIQNGGQKFAKNAYFSKHFSILLRFQNKMYFYNQQDCPIPKKYISVCFSVPFRFEKSTFGLN